MLGIPLNVSIYLCTKPTDMRRSFDGLHALIVQVFKQNPLDGHLFLFVNRRGDRLKILWWDHDGFVILSSLSSLSQEVAWPLSLL